MPRFTSGQQLPFSVNPVPYFESSLRGESPPPPPRACFGRAELVERIIDLAENRIPIALTGAGGIGKTSIALVVLNHDRIKERFGDDRRFVRCDQFPPSRASFLSRLSKVVGAGVDNPEDLTSLRSFLSSKEMFIVLDNVESILDPQGVNGQEIYEVVEELSRFSNICLAITSRITTIPPHCETIEIPTLSMEAGCDTFYRIYKGCERSDSVNDIIEQLEFHPLSVTLLATVAHQNKWDPARLAGEWGRRQTGMLQTEHKNSLAATIELSLASPLFKELSPHARELLEVVAFFPQGVDENNLDWLFPAVPNKTTILDKFYILSLTYRSNGFITMLAPLRDYFCPKDPKASPFLCSAKESYFARLSVNVDPNTPGFEYTHWIASEDVNVERLLDAFMSLDANSEDVLEACNKFMEHLYWHKPRQTVLGSKLEQLPDDHPFKPECLFQLSRLFGSVGNYAERKRLLTYALKLNREREDGRQVARTLSYLSDVNRRLGLRDEGIRQAKEALVIHEGLDEVVEKAWCLNALSNLLYEDNQFDAAEEAISRCITLLPGKGQGFLVCRSHRVLGRIYHRKGEGEKAICHYKVALGIASSFEWHNSMFWIHHSMAQLFYDKHNLDEAQDRIAEAKEHAADNKYCLGRAMQMEARIWYGRRRFEDAIPEAVRAIEIFEKLGAVGDLDKSRALLRDIEQAVESQATSSGSDFNGELFETVPRPTSVNVNSPFLARHHSTP